MPPPNATIRDRYHILAPVDERATGQVYHARDAQHDRSVLLGVLPLSDDYPVADIELVARQLATLRHERLLPIIEHFAEQDAYYMVCEQPDGQDLAQVLRARGPLPEKEVLEQARPLLNALEYLHTQRPPFFLGELWASDIWVTETGEWQLAPFTLARTIDPTPTSYLAPELAAPHVEPGRATDTYAFSALLYHVLTGQVPPPTIQQQAGTPLPAPRALNPELSALIEQVLLRGLQLREQNRYQTARELRLALDTVQIMAGRTLGLEPSGSAHTQPPADDQRAPEGAPPYVGANSAPLPAAQPFAATGAPPAGQAIPPGAPAGPPARRGLSTGCLIAAVVALLLLVVGLACALVLVLVQGPLRSTLGLGAPAVVATTGPPVLRTETSNAPVLASPQATLSARNPDARVISLSNAAQITSTRTITSDALGPAAYAPDNRALALVVGNDISLRNADTLTETQRLKGHRAPVFALAWSPDSARLASSAMDENTVRLWDAANGRLARTLNVGSGWVRSVVFSPDGQLLASGGTDNIIRLWNAASGAELRQLSGHTDWIGGLAFSPDGATLASAARDGTVRLWDVASGQPRDGFSFQTPLDATTNSREWASAVAFSPNGQHLAMSSTDNLVRLLDPATGAVERELRGHDDWVGIRGLVFTPDSKTLISAGLDGAIIAWNTATGEELGRFEGHRLSATGATLSGDGNQLAATSGDEGLLLLWEVDGRALVNSLRVGQGIITALAYADDSDTLATVGYNGVLRLNQISSERSQVLVGSSIASQPIAFLPSERAVAIGDEGQIVVLDGQSVQELSGLDGRPLNVVVSADGSTIAAGSATGAIAVWDGQTLAVRTTLQSQLAAVPNLVISDNGALVAAGGPPSDPRIQVIDTASGEIRRTLDTLSGGITGLAFQPRGQLLAASDVIGTLTAWDAQSGQTVYSAQATQEQGRFSGVAFSPDGMLLATGTLGGELVFWNAANGAEVARVSVPQSRVITLAFSPDGQQLAVSRQSGTAAVEIFTLPS